MVMKLKITLYKDDEEKDSIIVIVPSGRERRDFNAKLIKTVWSLIKRYEQ